MWFLLHEYYWRTIWCTFLTGKCYSKHTDTPPQSPAFHVPDSPECCSQCYTILSLAGNKALQKQEHDYSLTKETMKLFFQQIFHPVDQPGQRSLFCVFSFHLCSSWPSTLLLTLSPALILLWWLSLSASCRRMCWHSAQSLVCTTALPWWKRLALYHLLCFQCQLPSDSAEVERLMALVQAYMSPQCAPCLVSYRIQGLARSLNRKSVLRLICFVAHRPGNSNRQAPVKGFCGSLCIPGVLLTHLHRWPRDQVWVKQQGTHCLSLGDALLVQRKVHRVFPTYIPLPRWAQWASYKPELFASFWGIFADVDGQNVRWRSKVLLCIMAHILQWCPEG